MTSLCHLGDRNTIGTQIPWRGTDEAAMSQDADFILDALRHVKSREIVMHQLRQAAVELPGIATRFSCGGKEFL